MKLRHIVGWQGGRFDHADRLLHDIASTWDNCLHSTSDVKELVPEFYYQPEFLLNSNNFNLGTRQVSKHAQELLRIKTGGLGTTQHICAASASCACPATGSDDA